MAKDHPTGESGLYSALLELKTPEECYRFLQDVCSYAELSAMEQRYNIAEKLVSKQSYTSIMGNIGASSAIISRVSRVISREDSVLRRLLEEKGRGTHRGIMQDRARRGRGALRPRCAFYPLLRTTHSRAAGRSRYNEQSSCLFSPMAQKSARHCWWWTFSAAPKSRSSWRLPWAAGSWSAAITST